MNKITNIGTFKIENNLGTINPIDSKYIIIRLWTQKLYQRELTLHYTEEVNVCTKKITIQGNGYQPLKYEPLVEISQINNISNDIVYNSYNGEMIKKNCFNIEEFDFGVLLLDESKNKTFILYNYSNTNSFYFDFQELEFLIKDVLIIQPNKGTIEQGDIID